MTENPFNSPTEVTKAEQPECQPISSGRATYNVVSDTVTGVNLRWSDNKFQAVCVLASVVLSSSAGTILALVNANWNLPWYGGALFGAFAGLVIGVFSSGIFLMVYRAVQHFKGKHE